MIPGRDVIVIAWVDPEGDVQPTGRMVRRDGIDRPEFKPWPRPMAVVWSRDAADLPSGKAYCAQHGRTLLVLADTDDVLTRARDLVLKAGAMS